VSGVYVPKAQAIHAVVPLLGWYLPASQSLHWNKPIASVYLPAIHDAHVDDEVSSTVPAAHCTYDKYLEAITLVPPFWINMTSLSTPNPLGTVKVNLVCGVELSCTTELDLTPDINIKAPDAPKSLPVTVTVVDDPDLGQFEVPKLEDPDISTCTGHPMTLVIVGSLYDNNPRALDDKDPI
jgi:hypothetical protein